jgi:hypothetical protein
LISKSAALLSPLKVFTIFDGASWNKFRPPNMTDNATVGGMERLQLLEEDNEELWNSPSRRKPQKGPNQTVVGDTSSNPGDRPQQIVNNQNDTAFDREEAREAALRHELQTVKKINEAIEGVLESLERARVNMDVSPPPHMELILCCQGYSRIVSY